MRQQHWKIQAVSCRHHELKIQACSAVSSASLYLSLITFSSNICKRDLILTILSILMAMHTHNIGVEHCYQDSSHLIDISYGSFQIQSFRFSFTFIAFGSISDCPELFGFLPTPSYYACTTKSELAPHERTYSIQTSPSLL